MHIQVRWRLKQINYAAILLLQAKAERLKTKQRTLCKLGRLLRSLRSLLTTQTPSPCLGSTQVPSCFGLLHSKKINTLLIFQIKGPSHRSASLTTQFQARIFKITSRRRWAHMRWRAVSPNRCPGKSVKVGRTALKVSKTILNPVEAFRQSLLRNGSLA